MADVKDLFVAWYVDTSNSEILKILAYYGNNLVNVDLGTGIKMSIPSIDDYSKETEISVCNLYNKLYFFSKSFFPFTYKINTSYTQTYHDEMIVLTVPLATISKSYNSRIYLADTVISDGNIVLGYHFFQEDIIIVFFIQIYQKMKI